MCTRLARVDPDGARRGPCDSLGSPGMRRTHDAVGAHCDAVDGPRPAARSLRPARHEADECEGSTALSSAGSPFGPNDRSVMKVFIRAVTHDRWSRSRCSKQGLRDNQGTARTRIARLDPEFMLLPRSAAAADDVVHDRVESMVRQALHRSVHALWPDGDVRVFDDLQRMQDLREGSNPEATDRELHQWSVGPPEHDLRLAMRPREAAKLCAHVGSTSDVWHYDAVGMSEILDASRPCWFYIEHDGAYSPALYNTVLDFMHHEVQDLLREAEEVGIEHVVVTTTAQNGPQPCHHRHIWKTYVKSPAQGGMAATTTPVLFPSVGSVALVAAGVRNAVAFGKDSCTTRQLPDLDAYAAPRRLPLPCGTGDLRDARGAVAVDRLKTWPPVRDLTDILIHPPMAEMGQQPCRFVSRSGLPMEARQPNSALRQRLRQALGNICKRPEAKGHLWLPSAGADRSPEADGADRSPEALGVEHSLTGHEDRVAKYITLMTGSGDSSVWSSRDEREVQVVLNLLLAENWSGARDERIAVLAHCLATDFCTAREAGRPPAPPLPLQPGFDLGGDSSPGETRDDPIETAATVPCVSLRSDMHRLVPPDQREEYVTALRRGIRPGVYVAASKIRVRKQGRLQSIGDGLYAGSTVPKGGYLGLFHGEAREGADEPTAKSMWDLERPDGSVIGPSEHELQRFHAGDLDPIAQWKAEHPWAAANEPPLNGQANARTLEWYIGSATRAYVGPPPCVLALHATRDILMGEEILFRYWHTTKVDRTYGKVGACAAPLGNDDVPQGESPLAFYTPRAAAMVGVAEPIDVFPPGAIF